MIILYVEKIIKGEIKIYEEHLTNDNQLYGTDILIVWNATDYFLSDNKMNTCWLMKTKKNKRINKILSKLGNKNVNS